MYIEDDKEIMTLRIDETPGQKRLDVWLAGASGLSRSRIQSLISKGLVTVDGVSVEESGFKIKAGLTIQITLPPAEPSNAIPQDIPLSVIFEDDVILVIDKPAGIVTHPAPGHPDGTLVNAILNHCPDLAGICGTSRPGIVHRLDCDTSGAMIIAKTDTAMRSLSEQFQNGGVHKTYLTLVHGIPEPSSARIETLIGRHPVDRKKMSVVARNGRNAITNFRTIAEFTETATAELEVKILTGRTHQIRVHMKYIGCPVIGDAVYGSQRLDNALPVIPKRQCLHAHHIEFTHPVSGKAMAFESPLPADIIAVRDALR